MEAEETYALLFESVARENTDSILQLARKCISESPGEKEVVRALEVFLCDYLKTFTIESLESEVFGFACPAARNFVSEKLKHLEKNPTGCVEALGVSSKIISFFQKVFRCLNEVKKISVLKVKSFLTATSDVLSDCFSHCKASSKIYDSLFDSFADNLSNFFRTCCALQKQFLYFLTEKAEFDVKDNENILVLSEIMTSISKSGFALITLDIRTMAEVWKTFVSLTETYSSYLMEKYDFKETVSSLCNTISSNLGPGDNEDFRKIVKLNCFFLRIIIKFCELFVGHLENCHGVLLNLLLQLYKWDVTVAKKTNEDLINQLTVGIDPLLSQIMMDKNFIKKCCAVTKEPEKAAEFSILCCSVLKKLLDSNGSRRSLWFNEKENILEWIFISASSNQFMCSEISLPKILVNGKQKKFTDLYEYVLVTTSAFLMTATAEEYVLAEKVLVKNILQTNPVKALLAMDIWCLLARFADSELCFSQILILGKVLQEFRTGSFRVEKLFLTSLIQRLFPLLKQSHRTEFLKSFQPSLYAWVWEGSKMSGFTSNEACDVCKALLAQFDNLIDVAEMSEKGIQTWREGVMHEKFGSKILKLWKFNCEVLSSTPQSARFLKIICALTGCIVSEIPSGDLFMVLTQMKTLLKIGQPTCIKLYFTWILNSLSTVRIPPGDLQKDIILTTAEIFKSLLSSREAFVKQKALETFYSFAHRTSHEEVISMSVQNAPELKIEITNYLKKKPPERNGFLLKSYLNELAQMKLKHVCPSAGDNTSLKKIKLDAPELQHVVTSWRDNGNKIMESFHLLSDSQKSEIQNLCNSILALPKRAPQN